MPRIALELASECNNRCVFCARQGLEGHEPPSWEEALAAAGQHFDEITFVGAEPGNLPEETLLDSIRQARALGFRKVGLQTNGSRLAMPGLVSRLAKAGLSDLHLSLHGAQASVHDYHTGREGSYPQLLSTLGAARASGLRLALTTVLTRSNYRVLQALHPLLRNCGVHAWNIRLPLVAGALGPHFERVVPRLALALPFALHALESARRSGLATFIEGAPACLLGPYAVYALASETRAHAPVCASCPSRVHCPGLDLSYLERFRGDELSPKTSPAPDESESELRSLFIGLGPRAAVQRLQPGAPEALVSLGRR